MPNIDEIYQSEFLRADQLGGRPRRVVIEATTIEVLGQGENAQQKLIMKFKGAKQRLPLNKTNAMALSAAWGPNSDNWIGRTVELRPAKVMYAGKMVDCIRTHPVPAAPTPAPAAPTPEPDDPASDGIESLEEDIPWEN